MGRSNGAGSGAQRYRHPFSGDALITPGVRLGTNGVRLNTVPRNVVGDFNFSVRDMASNGSIVVAVGEGTVAGATTTVAVSSPDGLAWTARTLPAASNWASVLWTGVRFFASCENAANSAVSTDGATWSAGPTLPAAGLRIYAFAGLLIGIPVTTGTSYYTSADDGATWTTRTFPATIAAGFGRLAVAVTASAMVVVANVPSGTGSWANLVYRSTNGTTWTAQTLPGCMLPSAGGISARLLSSNSRFCLLYHATGGASGPLFCSTSTDGIAWGDFQSLVPVGVDGGNGSLGAQPGNQAGAIMANNTLVQSLGFATRGYLGSRFGVLMALNEYDANGGSPASRVTLGFLHTIDGTNWVFERALVTGGSTTTQSSLYGAVTPLPSGDGFAFGFMTASSGSGSLFCRTNPNYKEFTYVE